MESDLIKQNAQLFTYTPHRGVVNKQHWVCSMDFHQLAWRALHFSVRFGLWGRCYSKGKSNFIPCFSTYLLQQCHSFMCQKSSRLAGYNCIFSLEAAASTSVCWVWIRSQLSSSCQPPSVQSSQGPGLEQQLESSKTGAGTCTWVCFSVSPRGCAWQMLLAGPPAPWGNGDGISSSWDLPCCAPVHFWHLPEHNPCCQWYPWCSSHFSPSSGWVHSLFFCPMVKKIYILFLILISLTHAAEGGRGSFWRRGRGGLIDDPGWRWRTGWRAASCRTAVGALPGRKSLEHSAASFLEHLLLQKQSEKMLFE